MTRASLLLLLAAIAAVATARNAPDLGSWLKAGSEGEGETWAVLIAGSASWGNYRHQADVAHAYQILRRGGVEADRIITLMADDIAHNPENPHPGKMYNQPGGEDVYDGVQIDYTGSRVNARNFLAVLAGNSSATDNGRGPVLANTPQDRVFVYFSDHGAPGVLGMPSGPFLYADQLNEVIRYRSRHHGFKEMVVYIEACESGSLFEGVLEDDLDVYATTAANGRESSWGTYCPGMNPSPPPEFNTCLGDLYSVAWLENSDHADLNKETLKKQFQLVKARTSNNFTYQMGSHVMRFGTLNIDQEPVANYLGVGNRGDGTVNSASSDAEATLPWTPLEAVPQRDADLLHLWAKYSRAQGGSEKMAALQALEAEVARRAALDRSMRAAVGALVAGTNTLGLLQAKYNLGREASDHSSLVNLLVNGHLPRKAGTPLVQDWECLRGMVAAWEKACGTLDQYGMQYTRTFANLCNTGAHPTSLGATAQGACKAEPALRSKVAVA